MKAFEGEFTSLGAFLKYRVRATLNNSSGEYSLSGATSKPSGPQPLYMVSRSQFSQFFGFGEVDKLKGIPYRLCRFEVNSVI